MKEENEWNSITKRRLLRFVELNYDDIAAGGAADRTDRCGLEAGDYQAVEKALMTLLRKKHKKK